MPSGPPLDIRVEPKSSTELIVSWDPPQRDLWNGNILGYYVGFQEVRTNVLIIKCHLFYTTTYELLILQKTLPIGYFCFLSYLLKPLDTVSLNLTSQYFLFSIMAINETVQKVFVTA